MAWTISVTAVLKKKKNWSVTCGGIVHFIACLDKTMFDVVDHASGLHGCFSFRHKFKRRGEEEIIMNFQSDVSKIFW